MFFRKLYLFTIFFFLLAHRLTLSVEAINLNTITPLTRNTGGFGGDVDQIYTIGVALVGFTAFLVIVLGGLEYIASGGNPSKQSDAKDRIQSAIYGLILLLLSVVILNTINPQIAQLAQPNAFNPQNYANTPVWP